VGWGEEEDKSWRDLKAALLSAPVLRTPGRPTRPTLPPTRRLRHGSGAELKGRQNPRGHCLCQEESDTAEQNYSVTRQRDRRRWCGVCGPSGTTCG